MHGGSGWTESMLHGVAAAAVGLVLATTVHLGRRSLHNWKPISLWGQPLSVFRYFTKRYLRADRRRGAGGFLVSSTTSAFTCGGGTAPMNQLPQLIMVFSYLSLLTVGGGMAAFPELKYMTVDVHHWLTTKQLVHLYSLGQTAPGPNMMMVASIGDRVAGLTGALVTVCALYRRRCSPTVSVGFGIDWKITLASVDSTRTGTGVDWTAAAGCITIATEALSGWLNVLMQAVCVFLILLRSNINPAFLVLGAAVLGLFLFR